MRDADGHFIAGDFERSGGTTRGGRCWALPFLPERPELWLSAALEDWHEKTPDRVPAAAGWRSRTTWQTPEETAVTSALEQLHQERDVAIREFDRRERELDSDRVAVTAAADAGIRRLLTAQGDELATAVAETLRQLCFAVEDVDDAVAATPGSPKVEDLRVSDADDSSWTNITEVKGYAGGAKLSDIQKLGRYAALYLQRAGALPGSRWYVVNQFMNDDPDGRQRPLVGADEDVTVFAEDGGLVIDTRDLFRLLNRVAGGQMTAAEARMLLRGSVGIFQLPG